MKKPVIAIIAIALLLLAIPIGMLMGNPPWSERTYSGFDALGRALGGVMGSWLASLLLSVISFIRQERPIAWPVAALGLNLLAVAALVLWIAIERY